MKLWLSLLVLAACTGSSKTAKPVASDQDVATLHGQLATARTQSESYIWGGALPVGKDVLALIAKDTARAWWEPLTPMERFFLFEISPELAARAPADVRADAFCAGVKSVNAEWFSIPGSREAEATQAALDAKTPIATCLVKLFDDTGGLHYKDGESNLDAENHKWTVGDLAAGIVALSLGETYDNGATPEARAARRAELRAKVH